MFEILPIETWNTIYMVVVSCIIATVIGLPLGIVLCGTAKEGLFPHKKIFTSLEWIVSIGRSFPFAILMVALIPFTRFVLGTSLGTNASIVPLSVAAAPFIARLFQQALSSVDRYTVEAALLMGATPRQVIIKVLLPEALPEIIQAITTTTVTLIGYSAMVGMVGGGGLGKVAIQYGYLRFDTTIMIITIILLVLLVQLVQYIGQKMVFNIQVKRGMIRS